MMGGGGAERHFAPRGFANVSSSIIYCRSLRLLAFALIELLHTSSSP